MTNKSDIAISVRNLSKSYTIAHNAAKHSTMGEALMHRLKNPVQRTEKETFWALKDVSFDIQKGDVVGIIGRNGAGKSTLLKVLSRITEPTSGKAIMNGRVGSLLEVGTGFHPELTGRENIYMNGAILGMTKREIAKQFDAIVDFASVEQFLDTPVKRYSSGMYVRLAFAVAAHLKPEVLIVDEVLAVGDTAFQKKCLGKMHDVAEQEGKTVLFVSHNMAAMSSLCNKAFLLSQGSLTLQDNPNNVIRAYLSNINNMRSGDGGYIYRHRGSLVSIKHIELLTNDKPSQNIQSGDLCKIRIHYSTVVPEAINSNLGISIMLYADGAKLSNLWTNCHQEANISVAPHGTIDCIIPKWPFRSQQYRIDVYTHIGHDVQDWIEHALEFESHDGDYYESGVITNSDQGILFLDHKWSNHASK